MADKEKISFKEFFRESGVTGLHHSNGSIEEEWIPDLKNLNRYKTYSEMSENDPVIGAILFAIQMLIRQVNIRVQSASEEEKDVQAKEFLESCKDDMSSDFSTVVSEILSFLPYGYSYHEVVYKKRLGKKNKDAGSRSKYNDGKIGWRKIPIRSQDTLNEWVLDESGGIQGFKQENPQTGELVVIPIQKSLLFRTSSPKGSPEGRSVLRNAYKPWYYKKRIQEIEGIGVERDATGMPVIYAPSKVLAKTEASDSTLYDELKKILINLRRDEQEGVLLPGDRDSSGNRLFELELLSSGGSRQLDIDKIISRYNKEIAMVVLADFILLGHEKVGSFALSSDKTALFATALKSWKDEIQSVFNRHAIPRLFEINGWDLEEYPKFVFEDIETPDLKALGEYISKLSGAGIELFPDEELENYLRTAANLPEKIDEE